MKLISVHSVQIGQRLSFDLRAGNGALLLRKQTALTGDMLARLNTMGFPTVYIDGGPYGDVTVRQAIPDELKACLLERLEAMQPGVLRGHRPDIDALRDMACQIFNGVRATAPEPVHPVGTYTADNPLLLHAVNTAILTASISLRAGVCPALAENYVLAALAHDLCLDDMDYDTDSGYDHADRIYALMKETAAVDATCFMAAAFHHERFDGTGGPRKLCGKQINEGARILAAADLYDCVSSGYGALPMDAPRAAEYIASQSGRALDPDLMPAFTQSVAVYPTGAAVLLRDGRKAVVCRQNEGAATRPVVRIADTELDLRTDACAEIERMEL